MPMGRICANCDPTKRGCRRRANTFSGDIFHGPQTLWSTIEKEAYAIYWALLRLDDLVGGVHSTNNQEGITMEA